MNTKLNTSFKIICSFLIFALVSLSFYNALSLGFSWDEIFHHINGLLRFNYLVSLGKFQEYNYSNNNITQDFMTQFPILLGIFLKL